MTRFRLPAAIGQSAATLCLALITVGLSPVAAAGRSAGPSAGASGNQDTARGLVEACDGAAWATVIRPVPRDPAASGAAALPELRAIAGTGGWLAWPGVAAEGRFVLAAGESTPLLQPGDRWPASDALHVELALAPAVPAGADADRFRHLTDGVRLSLPTQSRADWHRWLRQPTRLVQLDDHGRVRRATGVQWAGWLDGLYAAAAGAEGPPLGVDIQTPSRQASLRGAADGAPPTTSWRQANPANPTSIGRADITASAGATNWRLWAPTAQAVHLCRHADAHGPALAVPGARFDLRTGIWTVALEGDRTGETTTWLVDVWVPGSGLVRQRVADPYAISLTAGSRRAWTGRLDDPRTEPPGWRDARRGRPLAAAADMAIYELHVRDFSRDDARVPAALRGTYAAFGVADSHGMRHLRALAQSGLTDVHLLPVFDFATVPEVGCVSTAVPAAGAASDAQQAAVMAAAARDCFNWGYDPLHFNAPEGSYATDADDPAVRIREFRQMVMALHAAGLRVGMDVVYNHLSASGQDRRSVLDRIVPGYYHRLDAAGRVTTSTCCANSATEHAMMGKLMRDSVRLWARHYRIDSFRFDLMGHQPLAEMLRLKRELRAEQGRDIPLIGEGWNFGEVADGARFTQASQLSLAGSGIASFSDRARDALRGGGVGDDAVATVRRQGLLNGLGLAPNAAVQAQGQAAQPQRAALLAAKDLLNLGLLGTLRDVAFVNADGVRRRGAEMRYGGQIAGYAGDPGEVVNYVENHDNPTLWDLNAFKLPIATRADERLQAQVLGLALTAVSQGVAYFHAGIDLLRSKSMDRNSYDSGDAFNRLDFSARHHAFGSGLPPAPDNAAFWPVMAERLVQPQMRASAQQMAQARQALRDWLAVRASSRVFRLTRSDEVAARVQVLNTGPRQLPALVALRYDGRGLPGGRWNELVVLANLDAQPLQTRLPALAGPRWALHPALADAAAADRRLRAGARLDGASGALALPARSAAVFVARD